MLCSSRWYLILFFSYGFPSVIAPALSTPAFSAPPSHQPHDRVFYFKHHTHNYERGVG